MHVTSVCKYTSSNAWILASIDVFSVYASWHEILPVALLVCQHYMVWADPSMVTTKHVVKDSTSNGNHFTGMYSRWILLLHMYSIPGTHPEVM